MINIRPSSASSFRLPERAKVVCFVRTTTARGSGRAAESVGRLDAQYIARWRDTFSQLAGARNLLTPLISHRKPLAILTNPNRPSTPACACSRTPTCKHRQAAEPNLADDKRVERVNARFIHKPPADNGEAVNLWPKVSKLVAQAS